MFVRKALVVMFIQVQIIQCVALTPPGQSVDCSQTPAHGSIVITNSAPQHVTVLQCDSQSCSGHVGPSAYESCPYKIPGATSSPTVVTLLTDPKVEYMLFYYNSSLTQECWPNAAGKFNATVTLPMKSITASLSRARFIASA